MEYPIEPIVETDLPWVKDIFRGWGAEFIVSRGRKIYPEDCEGFYAIDKNDRRVAMATYQIIGDQCELVTLDAFEKFQGLGTVLLEKVAKAARAASCSRLWLITTNDNLDAIRFYQRRGMTIAAIHINALELSRKIKPAIALVGQHGIPLRDEIEFEMTL